MSRMFIMVFYHVLESRDWRVVSVTVAPDAPSQAKAIQPHNVPNK
jgi:hypothetical protein